VRFIEGKNCDIKLLILFIQNGKVAGTVIEQDPAPDSRVKEDRTIYLTYSSTPPKVKMPNLLTFPFSRQKRFCRPMVCKWEDHLQTRPGAQCCA